jgi:signal peptidase II
MKTKTFSFIVIFIVLIDQILKSIFSFFRPTFKLSFFSLHYTTNTGAAFSIFRNQNLLLMFFGFIVLGYLFYKINDILKSEYILEFSFLFGGIIGNLIDRLVYGFVIDFIDIGLWPIFNIADSFIVLGVILIIIKEFKVIYRHKRKP